MPRLRTPFLVALALAQSGCGLGVSQLPEVWDRTDPSATADMEMQIKRAIYCELRRGALRARSENSGMNIYDGKNVTTKDDLPFNDSWGAQVTLTLTADEKTSLTPGVTFKAPLHGGVTNFPGEAIGATGLLSAVTYGPVSTPQSFSLGFGGTLSSENIRYDKYDFYYTAKRLVNGAGPNDICGRRPEFLGPETTSSPFIDASGLGIEDWLPAAVAVSDFQRSSRLAASGEGPALGSSGSNISDSATYDNKFVIITDGNISPTWNLVRIGTPTSPLLDMNRTRTHELAITIAPGVTTTTTNKKTGKTTTVNVGPSQSAINTHLATQIGSAVANALHSQ